MYQIEVQIRKIIIRLRLRQYPLAQEAAFQEENLSTTDKPESKEKFPDQFKRLMHSSPTVILSSQDPEMALTKYTSIKLCSKFKNSLNPWGTLLLKKGYKIAVRGLDRDPSRKLLRMVRFLGTMAYEKTSHPRL